jgi:hypothetical protein
MASWTSYLLVILVAILIGGIAGYFIITLSSLKRGAIFREMIRDIDNKIKKTKENPSILIEAEIEMLNERVERLENAILKNSKE